MAYTHDVTLHTNQCIPYTRDVMLHTRHVTLYTDDVTPYTGECISKSAEKILCALVVCPTAGVRGLALRVVEQG